MFGGGSRPVLRQQEKRHAGGEKKRFGRPAARQSNGARATDDHQIGMQGIQRGAVIDVILPEMAELEADVFAAATCRKIPLRGARRAGFA